MSSKSVPALLLRRLGRVMALVSAASLLAGASYLANAHAAPARATVDLTLWSGLSGPDQTGFIKIIDGFNSSQTAVHITYDQQAYNGYDQKLATALSANKGPNIWTGCAACEVNYITQGQLMNIAPFIKSSKVLNPKNFPKGIWNQGKQGSKFYLIPLDVVPLMMYYNKALLKKAGLKAPVLKGQKQIIAAAKKLTKGTDQYGMVIPTAWPMQFVWPTLLAQFGGKYYDAKSGKAAFNSKAGVKALTFLRSLIYKYKVGPQQYAENQDLKMLANGQAAQIFDGIWEYTNPSLQTLGKNEGISPVPQFGPKNKVFIGDLYFATYKNNTPAEEKAAVKWLEYYQKHSIEMAKVGPVPVYKPVFHSKAFKKLPAAVAAAKELSHGVFSPLVARWDDHWLYNDALWPVLRGETTDIKGTLDKAAQEVTAHLQSSGA